MNCAISVVCRSLSLSVCILLWHEYRHCSYTKFIVIICLCRYIYKSHCAFFLHLNNPISFMILSFSNLVKARYLFSEQLEETFSIFPNLGQLVPKSYLISKRFFGMLYKWFIKCIHFCNKRKTYKCSWPFTFSSEWKGKNEFVVP